MFGIDYETSAVAVLLILLWVAESLFPFFPRAMSNRWTKTSHDARNLVFGIGNSLLVAFALGAAFTFSESWAEQSGFGLLRLAAGPVWLETIFALFVFDLWMYAFHRANHVVPALWRLHRMHHSDRDMDATTAVRFHPGEALVSGLARLAVFAVLGASLWQFAVYEAIFLPVIVFHHSNVAYPRWLDYGLLRVLVTPAMHRVHHSRRFSEFSSNFGSVLPWWDMLLGTYTVHANARAIELGLDGLDAIQWQSHVGMLATPAAPLSPAVEPSLAQDVNGGGHHSAAKPAA